MQTLINKIASHTTETLIEVVKGLNNNFGENTNIVFDLALNELEVRMTEDKFIQLCNSL